MDQDMQVRLLIKLRDLASQGLRDIEQNGKRAADGLRRAGTEGAGGMDSMARAAGVAKGALAALGAGVSFGAIASAIRSAANELDRLRDQAIVAGVEIQRMAGYAFAFSQLGSSADAAVQALTRLARSQGEAVQKAGEAREAFQRLGFGLNELRALKPEDLFIELIDQFGKLPDEAERNVLANQLFSRSYRELFLVFNAGRGEVESLIRQQAALNPNIEKNATAADQFNDAVGRLKESIRGLVIQADGLSSLSKSADTMTEWARAMRAIKENMPSGGYALGALESIGRAAKRGIGAWFDLESIGRAAERGTGAWFDLESIGRAAERGTGAWFDTGRLGEGVRRFSAAIKKDFAEWENATVNAFDGAKAGAEKAKADMLKAVQDGFGISPPGRALGAPIQTAEQKAALEAALNARAQFMREVESMERAARARTIQGIEENLRADLARIEKLGLAQSDLARGRAALESKAAEDIARIREREAAESERARKRQADAFKAYMAEEVKAAREAAEERRRIQESLEQGLSQLRLGAGGETAIAETRRLADLQIEANREAAERGIVDWGAFYEFRDLKEREIAGTIREIQAQSARESSDYVRGLKIGYDDWIRSNRVTAGVVADEVSGLLSQTQSSFTSLVADSIRGAEDLKEAWKRWGQETLAQIAAVIAKMLIMRAIEKTLGTGGGGGGDSGGGGWLGIVSGILGIAGPIFGGAFGAGGGTGGGVIQPGVGSGGGVIQPGVGSGGTIVASAFSPSSPGGGAMIPAQSGRGGGDGATNIYIQAMDSQSMEQALSKPAAAKVFVGNVRKALAQDLETRRSARTI